MDRLTEYHCGVAVIQDKNKLKEAMEKLANYEDFEEQGLLMRLKCRVGDKAYHVIRDDVVDPPVYISEHEITNVSADAVYFADDWWTFEEMAELNVFLTIEEAEARKEEMEREG